MSKLILIYGSSKYNHSECTILHILHLLSLLNGHMYETSSASCSLLILRDNQWIILEFQRFFRVSTWDKLLLTKFNSMITFMCFSSILFIKVKRASFSMCIWRMVVIFFYISDIIEYALHLGKFEFIMFLIQFWCSNLITL